MGIRPAPSYANIFMAKIDQLAINLGIKFGEGIHPIKAWKRFLDDIFILWTGSIKKLHLFLEELNQIHPTIKFTLSHTTPLEECQPCDCKPSEYLASLDTSTSIFKNKIIADLYKKQIDVKTYFQAHVIHHTSQKTYPSPWPIEL